MCFELSSPSLPCLYHDEMLGSDFVKNYLFSRNDGGLNLGRKQIIPVFSIVSNFQKIAIRCHCKSKFLMPYIRQFFGRFSISSLFLPSLLQLLDSS